MKIPEGNDYTEIPHSCTYYCCGQITTTLTFWNAADCLCVIAGGIFVCPLIKKQVAVWNAWSCRQASSSKQKPINAMQASADVFFCASIFISHVYLSSLPHSCYLNIYSMCDSAFIHAAQCFCFALSCREMTLHLSRNRPG